MHFDYLLLNLILKDKEQYNIVKSVGIKIRIIKKHYLELYFALFINNTLNE